MRSVFTAAIIALASAAFPAVTSAVDFVKDIQPILREHCYRCHGEQSQKSGLRLDIKSEVWRGGDGYGPSIIPGDPQQSPLVQLVSSKNGERMPPDAEPLSAQEIAKLTRWVAEGAHWPADADSAVLPDRIDHWSFKPLRDPAIPDVERRAWPRNAIDYFVMARLESEGLSPAPPADPITWLRRVSLDLTGLPPTLEEATEFLAAVQMDDAADGAYERAVDRLLHSPRYGERWAQHWLDLVRYADTDGFEVNTERPNAWPYRDYVIDAFNQDTPYDRFIGEQIVGDALQQDAATGFLVTASLLLSEQIGKDEASKRLARQDALDEIIVNITQTFLGLSVGCARCHDHKFDPISHRDYYAMQALVAGVEYDYREVRTPETLRRREHARRLEARLSQVEQQLGRLVPLAGGSAERPPVNARMNADRFEPILAKRLRFTVNATNQLEPCIDELEVFDTQGRNVALASAGATATSSGSITAANRHELTYINDGKYGNSRSWLASSVNAWVIIEFEQEQLIERVVWGRDREGTFTDRLAIDYQIEVAADGDDPRWQRVADSTDRAFYLPGENQLTAFSGEGLSAAETEAAQALLSEKHSLQSQIAQATENQLAFVGNFREPDVIRLLSRGDPEQPREEVAPAMLSALSNISLSGDAPEQQRRLVLAQWIADAENPLTARVMVNRIWQGHFGTGLVDTTSDLGRAGSPPSHPELLDALAQQFIRSGWSIKQLHRMIVLSATYRQSTQYDAVAAAKDADARLLWRFPRRRLEAEAIRDSMLAASGALNLQMGGAGFDLFDKRGGLTGFNPVESFAGPGLRRLIYAHKVRRERDGVFGAFDCPDAGQSTARRRESTTPVQALNLLNSRFTLEQADALAARVKGEVGEDLAAQINRTYQLVLCRGANQQELDDAMPVVAEHGLSILGRVLFNSNEFLFLP